MILSDKDIADELFNGDFEIFPEIEMEQLQPSSIDLKLSQSFYNREKGHFTSNEITINPSEFILASTREKIKMPNYLIGRVEGRSSYGRLGLLIHVSAGFIDPGFEGRITLEMVNLSKKPIVLNAGCRICQIVLEELKSACVRPYGSEGIGSKYQNQYFAEPSKINGENENEQEIFRWFQ